MKGEREKETVYSRPATAAVPFILSLLPVYVVSRFHMTDRSHTHTLTASVRAGDGRTTNRRR